MEVNLSREAHIKLLDDLIANTSTSLRLWTGREYEAQQHIADAQKSIDEYMQAKARLSTERTQCLTYTFRK